VTAAGRTVTVGLRGGLGNQIFQYATARALARREGRRLYLDARPLQRDPPGTTPRTYALDIFRIDAPLITGPPSIDPALVALIVERRPSFQPALLRPIPFDHVLLQGFWQSERYCGVSSASGRAPGTTARGTPPYVVSRCPCASM
jgi:hypothetical protein